MLEILDSLIATAAVVLGLSLVVQAIQQIFKQALDLKTEYMRNELLALFSTPQQSIGLLAGLRRSSALAEEHRKADPFADRLITELENVTKGLGFRDLHLLENIDTAAFIDMLKSLPVSGDTTVADRFKKATEDAGRWFDMTKGAFQEHYERRMKYWAFGISAAVVLVMNANLLDVYKEFSHNKPLRDAAVKMGERFAAMSRDSLVVRVSDGKKDTTFVAAKPDSVIVKEIKENSARIQSMLDDQSFQVMGWTDARLAKYRTQSCLLNIVEMVLGWLGMTLLVSLGAPFWYDFLKTVMGVKEMMKRGK